jgi:hypothetical protein
MWHISLHSYSKHQSSFSTAVCVLSSFVLLSSYALLHTCISERDCSPLQCFKNVVCSQASNWLQSVTAQHTLRYHCITIWSVWKTTITRDLLSCARRRNITNSKALKFTLYRLTNVFLSGQGYRLPVLSSQNIYLLTLCTVKKQSRYTPWMPLGGKEV